VSVSVDVGSEEDAGVTAALCIMTGVMVKSARAHAGEEAPRLSGLSPRERIVRSAAELIQAQGVSGTGLREIVARAAAPRGSLQHYFPDGKDQLVGEALLWSGESAGRRVRRVLERLDSPSPGGLFAGVVSGWRRHFLTKGFDMGCPLVAAAADVAADNDDLRPIIDEAFDRWHRPFEDGLVATGVPASRAASLAVLAISALEGAIVLSRIRRDVAPLDAIEKELVPLLDAGAVG
jgi:AcrR family transcriptional regulator